MASALYTGEGLPTLCAGGGGWQTGHALRASRLCKPRATSPCRGPLIPVPPRPRPPPHPADIKRKEGRSVFIRPHEGLFGLREWVEQGVAFQVRGRGRGIPVCCCVWE